MGLRVKFWVRWSCARLRIVYLNTLKTLWADGWRQSLEQKQTRVRKNGRRKVELCATQCEFSERGARSPGTESLQKGLKRAFTSPGRHWTGRALEFLFPQALRDLRLSSRRFHGRTRRSLHFLGKKVGWPAEAFSETVCYRHCLSDPKHQQLIKTGSLDFPQMSTPHFNLCQLIANPRLVFK